MASNGTGLSGRSAVTFVDDSPDGCSPSHDAARLQPVRHVVGDSEAAPVCAGAALARVERDVDQVWCDSMQAPDRAMSPRLAELSHALPRTAMLRSLRLAAVALMVGLAAVAGGVQPAGAAGPRHGVIEGLFDVGGGHRLFLRCTGNGSPTVVMDASAGEDSSTWSDVEPLLARVTRVCVYDRAGLGRSDAPQPGPVARTSQTMVDELTTLLDVAHVSGPYVVVGHSIAGWNVHVFAREDGGDTVVGVVLIDATPPEFLAVYESFGFPIPPPEVSDDNLDGLDFHASAAQAMTAGPFPPVPLAVLTHGTPGDLGPLEEPWQQLQVAQSQLSPEGRLIVARKSGHYIQNDQPRLVFAAIVQVVARARHNEARGHADSAAG